MPRWNTGKIVKILDETPVTKRFWLEVEGVESLDFQAGQFVTMDLPIHEKRLKRWRSYSIANAADGGNVLEFCIVQLEGGLATQYLFNEAKVGTEIKFKGPAGVFTLPKVIDKDLIFVCTGTGIAPFRSMLLHIFNQNIPHQKLHLIFGTRKQENILYREEMENLAASHPEFTYDIALSREVTADTHEGYVHKIYEQVYANPQADRLFYLCGWSYMIDEAIQRLKDLGYDEKQVIFELYG